MQQPTITVSQRPETWHIIYAAINDVSTEKLKFISRMELKPSVTNGIMNMTVKKSKVKIDFTENKEIYKIKQM